MTMLFPTGSSSGICTEYDMIFWPLPKNVSLPYARVCHLFERIQLVERMSKALANWVTVST